MTVFDSDRLSPTTLPSGDVVLLDRRTGRYWQCNPTAVTVVAAHENGRTRPEIVDELAVKYPHIERSILDDDVGTFLEALQQSGIANQ